MLWTLKLRNGWLDFDGSENIGISIFEPLVGENTQQGQRGIKLFSLEYQRERKDKATFESFRADTNRGWSILELLVGENTQQGQRGIKLFSLEYQ